MRVMATARQLAKHEAARHVGTRNIAHSSACGPQCLWAVAIPPKIQNGPDDRGGKGRAGRKRARGWRKGWWKTHIGALPPQGSFRFIQVRASKEKSQ